MGGVENYSRRLRLRVSSGMGRSTWCVIRSSSRSYSLAYWAQVTRRSPWLWFFLGLLCGPITGIVLASKNSKDLKESRVA